MNEIKRNRLLNLRAAVSDWNPSVGIPFSVIQAVFVQLIDIILGGRRRDDEDEDGGEIEGCDHKEDEKSFTITDATFTAKGLELSYEVHADVYTLTRKREIKLFKRLLKETVELTDASSETATIREILETEAIVLIERGGARQAEYDLADSVFWSKDKTRAIILLN